MSNTTILDKTTKILNFNPVDKSYTSDDVLDAYLKGKSEMDRKIKEKIITGLQTSAMTSNLVYEKLKNIKVDIKEMYLRLVDLDSYESLVIISDEDYYDKTKRWDSYKIARQLNSNIDDLDIAFLFMPSSDSINYDIINSEGFLFKYGDTTES
ncbi:hypothetical protein [Aquimarina macrocephali]|uniref:hypothetical protein n=1 Tax=Aquimarina macrocephali TaxID=666563 RepID=UPI003F674848